MAKPGDMRDQALHRIFMLALQVRRSAMINSLLQVHSGKVIGGPFAGMALLPEACDLPSKLLGCYEVELHAAIAKAIGRDPAVVVNVGCGQGYYAVGLAQLLPRARVFAFDSNPGSQEICRRAAFANRVSERVLVSGKCEIEFFRQISAEADRPLLIVDCEGAELDLLDPDRAPELMHCDLIIECHDFMDPRITPTLRERFSGSHDLENVVEGARDPNQFESLRGWQSIDRWIAMSEGRTAMTNWLLCWAH